MHISQSSSCASRRAIDPALYSELFAFFRRRARGAYEDLAQETCARLLEAKQTEISNMRAYAFVIARRVLWAHGNALARSRVELPAEEVELCAQDPADETRCDVGLTRALDRLSTRAQQTLALHYAEGLSTSEIALRFSLPHGTVKSIVRSARFTLHDALAGTLNPPV